MHSLIHIEFTRIVDQFKQRNICKFIHDMFVLSYLKPFIFNIYHL
jgi:hypothetical protein